MGDIANTILCALIFKCTFFQEIKEHGGTLIEGLIVYVTELEERKCTVELLAEPSGDGGGESSDANFDGEAFVQPLDVIARNGVQALGLTRMARVLQGFANLIRCTKMPGGKVQVYEADAIAEAIRLAKAEDGQYVRQAVRVNLGAFLCHFADWYSKLEWDYFHFNGHGYDMLVLFPCR